MYNYPRVEEPEDQWEWELSIHARIQNLTSDDTFEVLENLPPIPINPIVAEWVPQDVPDDDDDDGWNREMHRHLSNLQSRSEISTERDEKGHPVVASLPDLGLKESKEMGLPDIGGLPELPSISGLPDFSSLPSLPELPKLPDDFDRDIEERFRNLLTDTSCANDDALASCGVPNLGIEVNRNDIPQLDLDNIPGAVPPCSVGAKKKEAKKIQKEAKKKSKNVKKQLKKEADRHDAVSKKKKEKAQELRQSICHSCCVWTRVLWQVARQRSDGDRLVAAGLGQLVMGVTFIPLFYGWAPLVATERAVLALFCTPTS